MDVRKWNKSLCNIFTSFKNSIVTLSLKIFFPLDFLVPFILSWVLYFFGSFMFVQLVSAVWGRNDLMLSPLLSIWHLFIHPTDYIVFVRVVLLIACNEWLNICAWYHRFIQPSWEIPSGHILPPPVNLSPPLLCLIYVKFTVLNTHRPFYC